MPSFAEHAQHKNSHHAIHEGLDKLSVLIVKYNKDNTQYSPEELRQCLDSFKSVLFAHLDEEVYVISPLT